MSISFQTLLFYNSIFHQILDSEVKPSMHFMFTYHWCFSENTASPQLKERRFSKISSINRDIFLKQQRLITFI